MPNYIKDYFTEFDDPNVNTHELFNKCYAMAILPRSGSTWITNLLSKNGLGNPDEWINAHSFRDNAPRYSETNLKRFIYRLINEKKQNNGIWSIQLTYWHINKFLELLPLSHLLGDSPKWLYLRRKDIIAQGISLYRSTASGYWHSYNSKELKQLYDSVPYDSEQILHWTKHILDQEIFFETFFSKSGISPSRYFHEDLTKSPEPILSEIISFLNISNPNLNTSSEIKVIAKKSKTEEWKDSFITKRPDFIKSIEDTRPSYNG